MLGFEPLIGLWNVCGSVRFTNILAIE